MKKLLLALVVANLVGSSAFALVDDKTVKNDTDHVIFVAWKNTAGSKSQYERIMPGESKKFGVVDRGYGIVGLYGNTLQVELGQKVSNKSEYKNVVKKSNKKMDPETVAAVNLDKGKVAIAIN